MTGTSDFKPMAEVLREENAIKRECIGEDDIVSALASLHRSERLYDDMAAAFKALASDLKSYDNARKEAVSTLENFSLNAQKLMCGMTSGRLPGCKAIVDENDITSAVDDNQWASIVQKLVALEPMQRLRQSRRAYDSAEHAAKRFGEKVAKLKARESIESGSTGAESRTAKALLIRTQGVLNIIEQRKELVKDINLKTAAEINKFVSANIIPAQARELTDEEISAINGVK